MLKFTLDGKTVRPEDLTKELMRSMSRGVAEELRERITSIRLPETGEFPTVVIEGESLGDMTIRVEASDSLLDIVRSRLSPEEQATVSFATTSSSKVPQAFLSYGFEDRELAETIANSLQVNGIETWWAEWEIGSGDSIRRKIDAGLAKCTHFIVLLTPTSIGRPWVNEEIDAGFMRKVSEQTRFIPLRCGLAPDALPPLMRSMLSPSVEKDGSGLEQLFQDIHGVTRKPPLGAAPVALAAPRTGYSPAATAIAGLMVMQSENGLFGDPQLQLEEIMGKTTLSREDVTDGLHELRHRVQVSFDRVLAKDVLFAEFDKYFRPWDPAADAMRLAVDIMNDKAFPESPAEICARYGWSPRQINPAIAYLHERGLARIDQALGTSPYVAFRIIGIDATRRFVKSRS